MVQKVKNKQKLKSRGSCLNDTGRSKTGPDRSSDLDWTNVLVSHLPWFHFQSGDQAEFLIANPPPPLICIIFLGFFQSQESNVSNLRDLGLKMAVMERFEVAVDCWYAPMKWDILMAQFWSIDKLSSAIFHPQRELTLTHAQTCFLKGHSHDGQIFDGHRHVHDNPSQSWVVGFTRKRLTIVLVGWLA